MLYVITHSPYFYMNNNDNYNAAVTQKQTSGTIFALCLTLIVFLP